MMLITSIESYVQTVTNVPALLQNKEFLESLHPRYTEILARCSNASSAGNNNNPGGSSPSPSTPLDAAIQNLLETGTTADSTVNKHTIGVIGLLCAKTRTQEFNTNFEHFLVQVSSFMDVADWGQLRMVAGVVTEIAYAITDQMIRRNQPILGINMLGMVANKLQAHDKMLTCVHSCVLQLCCAAYNFKAALPYIIDDFEEFTVDLKQSDNTLHLLTYLYYSGLTYTALKDYDKAIYFFEACTRVPAITLSHVMLESYKKYILVCLIHLGEVPQPHKCSAQVVNRVLKPSCIAYTELASSFLINSDSLSNCIAKHLDTFRRDQNYGLVKQVRNAHMRVLIRKLTRTFLTLSLEDVGKRAVVEGEAEQLVLGMIADGSVVAKINQKDGMVRFMDHGGNNNNNRRNGGGTRGNGSGLLEIIDGKINTCVELNKRINMMNERISTNPEFISKVVVSLDSSGAGGGGGTGGSAAGNSLVGGDLMDQGLGGGPSGSSSSISSSGKFGGGGGASSSSAAGGVTSAASSSGLRGSSNNSNNSNNSNVGGSAFNL